MRRFARFRSVLTVMRVAALSVIISICAAEYSQAERISEASIRSAADRCIRLACSEKDEIEIDFDRISPSSEVKGRDLEIRPRLTRHLESRGPVLVTLEFWNNGQKIDKQIVSARVRVYRDVLVAAERLSRHASILPEAVRTERRDIRTLRDQAFTDISQLDGKRTRRLIAQGSVIGVGHMEGIPLVERGESVRVTIKYGAITVSATGKALDDGAKGDLVRVKNSRGGKSFQGVVVGEGLVRVVLANLPLQGG